MANTAWHVRTNLENVINNASAGSYKFALFSGHDTTVQPFLAAVLKENWDQQWPAYAAMITIELYEAVSGGYLFRMVYNGEAMTVPGCTDTLCDVNVLINALAFGEENPDCSVDDTKRV
jgi:lysophosphatidic acid phosphatase type 6